MALLVVFYGEKGGKGLLKSELNNLAVLGEEVVGGTAFEPVTFTVCGLQRKI